MNVLVLCASRVDLCPRAVRLVEFFAKFGHHGHLVGVDSTDGRVDIRSYGFCGRVANLWLLLTGAFETYIRRKVRLVGIAPFQDAIVCHDLLLLPVVCKNLSWQRLVFDAREFYPSQGEHRIWWRLTTGRLNHYLLQTYLPMVDEAVTVSEGIADRYRRQYGRGFNVVYSMAAKSEVEPRPVGSRIRAVHHGNSNGNRRLEVMVRAFAACPDIDLDMFILRTDRRSFQRLQRLATEAPNVRLLAPVPFEKLVKTLAGYDLGVFFVAPKTFNLRYSMPNKLFEYVQARLAIIVSPLDEAARFVSTHGVGFVCEGFQDTDLTRLLSNLSSTDIVEAKHRSDHLAKIFHSDEFGHRFLALLSKSESARK